MSDDGDPCTGVEMNNVLNEACKMDCSKPLTPSKNKSNEKESFFRYVVAISVILLANTLMLAASGACVIVALVEISQLKSEVTDLSTLQQNVSDVMEAIATIASNLDHNANDIDLVNQLPLQIQEQLLMFQQNVSDVIETIATNLDRNSDDLYEL